MATTFVFNIAKGRFAEFYNRVKNNDPSTSAFVAVAVNTSAFDATLQDLDTLADVLAGSDTDELNNLGYSRVVLTDSDFVPLSPDDSDDVMRITLPTLNFGEVEAGMSTTNIIIGYDANTGSGTDADIIPVSCHEYAVSPNGTEMTATVGAFGLIQAA